MRSDIGQVSIEYAALLVLAAGVVFVIGQQAIDQLPSEICVIVQQEDCETGPESPQNSHRRAIDGSDEGPVPPPRNPDTRRRVDPPGAPPRPPRNPDTGERVHPINERLNAMIEKYEDLHYEGSDLDPSIRDLDDFMSQVTIVLDDCAAGGPGGEVFCPIPPEGESLPTAILDDRRDVLQLATDLWYYGVRSGLIVENDEGSPRWQPAHCSPDCYPGHIDPSHTISATILRGLADHPSMTENVVQVLSETLGNVVNSRLPQPPPCRIPCS